MHCVILCTYNGEKYLEKQIKSIMEQDREDFCLLYSDDGSSDSTKAILQSLQERYGKKMLAFPRSMKSGSPAKHFLSILSALAKGEVYIENLEYIFLADQDDCWFPDKLSKTISVIKEEERKFGESLPILCHTDCTLVNAKGELLAKSYRSYQKLPGASYRFSRLLLQNHVTGASVGINKALLQYCKEIPEQVKMHDHWLALLANCFGEIQYLPYASYAYRQHEENVLGAKKASVLKECEERLAASKEKDKEDAIHSSYRALFSQGRELKRLFGDLLPEIKRKVLEAFLSLEGKSRLGKITTMALFGIYPYPLYRGIGAMLFLDS
ncbi:glycosyltransferase family 2 protein [Oribacterium sinus]|jgi:family 2 glucosyltransferase|uniref:glycosyltransferase family 2 protein n=1 Tax=Oribacterium sinus TaxID=237576 RepID=UPI0028EF13FF|nr:glycosyltransferase family 2 protein [Oribacterium sinus]